MMVPGETCWRIERALEYTVFVDAADYFPPSSRRFCAPSAGCCSSAGSSRTIRLDPRSPGRGRDDRLGHVLEAAVRANPRLEIGVLQWGMGMMQSFSRGVIPMALFVRRLPDRLTFALDHHHPLGAAHHQKIVVIDDCLAFAVLGHPRRPSRTPTSTGTGIETDPAGPRRSTQPWHDRDDPDVRSCGARSG